MISPLPPLAIFLEGYIPQLFQQPLIAENLIHSFYWMILVFLLYKIVTLFCKNLLAFLAVLTFSYIYYSEPHDIVVGYFELLLIVISILFLITIKTLHNPSTSNQMLLIACSIAIPLIKQNFVITSMAILGFVSFYFFRNYLNLLKGFILYIIGSYAFTAVILYLYSNSIFSQLNGKAKNPNTSFLIENLILNPVKHVGVYSTIMFLVAIYISNNSKKLRETKIAAVLVLLAILNSVIFALNQQGYISVSNQSLFYFAMISLQVVFLTIFIQHKKILHNLRRTDTLILFTPSFLIFLIFVFLTFSSNGEPPFAERIAIVTIFAGFKVYLAALLLICLNAYVAKGAFFFVKNEVRSFRTRKSTVLKIKDSTQLLYFEVLVVLSFSFAVANSLSGGLTIQSFPIFGCVLLAKLLSMFIASKSFRFRKIVALFSIASVLLMSSLQMYKTPYEWWGFSMKSLSLQQRNLSTLGLPWFKTTIGEERFLVKTQSTFANERNRQSQVFYGPNNAGMRFLFDTLPVFETKCVTMWWDVCAEEYAEQDYKKIVNDRPEYVVWNQFPDFVSFAHEQAFRVATTKSALRRTQEWILTQIELGHYRIVAEENFGSEKPKFGWRLLLLKKITNIH